ncbi:hypothetical protein KKG83_06330 [Candidatus Micrarchaeota archaeon]|nr:hypothetical protein [Candidatus Micrarchaeota archaeon]MBU2477060.1 hypothetical protein [Candidatus Micrarchaeota archaeon]
MELNLVESFQKDSSAKVLVLSNLITIVLAVAFSWNIIIILWSFWLQSIIIGFFNFFRILTLKDYSTENFKINSMPVTASSSIKIFVGLFFAFHYGFFHLIYAVFLGVFTFASGSITSGDIFYIGLAGLIFFFNHLFSFLYFKNKPKKQQNIGAIMFYPYARIIPMHLTIIFGGIFLFSGIGSAFVLVFFLLLKTGADLVMHFIEHKEQL